MLTLLAQPQAAASVALLQSSFVVFLNEVELHDDVELDLADFWPPKEHYWNRTLSDPITAWLCPSWMVSSETNSFLANFLILLCQFPCFKMGEKASMFWAFWLYHLNSSTRLLFASPLPTCTKHQRSKSPVYLMVMFLLRKHMWYRAHENSLQLASKLI